MKFVVPRQLVYPGDLIATVDESVEGAVYLEGNRYRSLSIGLVEFRNNAIVVVPLGGIYKPKPGDLVVGYIVDVLATGWEVDVKAFLPAILPLGEATTRHVDLETTPLTSLLNIGDVVLARVKDVDLTDEYPIVLTLKDEKLGKIETGAIVEITPAKIPRVVGKGKSMLGVLSETGCDIAVGQNGRIWIKCKSHMDEVFLSELIKKIERESHVAGLTDRVREAIEKYKREGRTLDV